MRIVVNETLFFFFSFLGDSFIVVFNGVKSETRLNGICSNLIMHGRKTWKFNTEANQIESSPRLSLTLFEIPFCYNLLPKVESQLNEQVGHA
jgi:hypothetical protein